MTYDSVDMSIRNHAHEEGLEAEREMALEVEVEERVDAILTNPELSDDFLGDAFVEFEEGACVDEDFFLQLLQADSDDDLLEVAKEMRGSLMQALQKIVRNNLENN